MASERGHEALTCPYLIIEVREMKEFMESCAHVQPLVTLYIIMFSCQMADHGRKILSTLLSLWHQVTSIIRHGWVRASWPLSEAMWAWCIPVLLLVQLSNQKERFQCCLVHLCKMIPMGRKHGISSYQPLKFYQITHSLVVKCMLWLRHLTHHYRSILCLTWIVVVAQCPQDAYKLVGRRLLVRSSAPLHYGSLKGKTQQPCTIVSSTLKPKREVSMLSCASLATELLSQYP